MGGCKTLLFLSMGRARCIIEAVLLEFLTKQGVSKDDDIAVAYSGGPDSAALLSALSAIGWKRPIAIHIDHGIRDRDELDAERSLVEAVCASLGARLILSRVRPGAILERARSSGEGVEAEARHFRYAALRFIMGRTGTKVALLAHTRDDQIETLLMRLFSGSGAGGLKGIPKISGPFMRPFLGIEKASLLSYLEMRGIAYSVDSTNASDDYLRNRIRRVLVPALDVGFPGWRKGLILTATKAARDEEALSKSAEELAFAPSPGTASDLFLPASSLLSASEAVAVRSIVGAAAKLLGAPRFPSRMAATALEVLRGGEGSFYRGAGLELRIRDGLAILRRGLDFPMHGGYFVMIDRPRRVNVGSLEVRAAWVSNGFSGIRSDSFRFPLVVRSRRPGDAIALKNGTKRLDVLLSEWALSEDARRVAPIVEDRDGIVAVLGAVLGGEDKYRERPKSLGLPGEAARYLSIIVKGA